MKVEIDWTEEVSYRSVVEIDDNDFAEWWARIKENQPDAVMSEGWIKDFLNEEEAYWFEQCDTNEDCVAVNARSLDGINRYWEGPAT